MINKDLEDKIKWIQESNTADLVENIKTPQIGGPLRFTEIIPAIDELKLILKTIDFGGLRMLPNFRVEQLEFLLNPIFLAIDHIQQTDRDTARKEYDQKQSTISFFSRKREDSGYYEQVKGHIWSIIVETITFKVHQFTASLNIDDKINSIYEIKNHADESLQKINQIVSSAQQQLGNMGIENHAKIFKDQSENHKKNSRKWLIASMAGVGVTLFYLIYAFFYLIQNTSPTKKIETGIFSVTIISILSYIIMVSVRNYSAEKHNQLLNKHKANCLDSYKTFVESADDDIRSAILLHATQTIFSHQSPGFLSKEVNQSPTPIMEIIRSFSKTADLKQ